MDQIDELLVDRRAVEVEMYCVIPLAAQSLAQTVDRIALAGPRKFEGPLHRRQILCHAPFYAQNRRATIRGILPGLPRFRLTSCQHSRAIPGPYRPSTTAAARGKYQHA